MRRIRTVLLAIILSGAGPWGCLMDQRVVSEKPISMNHPVRINSEDPVLRSVICEVVDCWEGANREIDVSIEIGSVSRDIARNTVYSLAGLTLPLLVSSSAEVGFHVEIAGDKNVSSRTLQSTGRVGMWAVVPVYAGLFGTLIGSAISRDLHPEHLRTNCLENHDEYDCKCYGIFLKNAVGEVRYEMAEMLDNDSETL